MEPISIRFKTNMEEYANDYMDIIRAFYPKLIFDENSEKSVKLTLEDLGDEKYCTKIDLDINCLEHYENSFNLEVKNTLLAKKSLKKRFSKAFLYKVLSEYLDYKLPYGSLTGIRPTKLYHDLKANGVDVDSYFKDLLLVSDEKRKLISTICKNQEGIYSKDERFVDVFVNIPICVTRCSYCSFVSSELKYVKSLICPYTRQILDEVNDVKAMIKEQNLTVKSVYIGGGTPTSIDDENFALIAKACDFSAFGVKEYTIEAGRPDTITREKLNIMRDAHVTRISINPQSFNQKTLDLIGRTHSVQAVYDVYNMAREYDFDINMDLIAMLPNESLDDFKFSVNEALRLSPDNITVHTLALKRGSKLHEDNYDNSSFDLPNQMVDYAMKAIMQAGYEPYYMYKQKHVSGNLENVGYCKSGKACIYNIDIMEETTSIMASGAGAISKRVFISENRIERFPEPKGIQVYLERKDEVLKNKRAFFS